MKKYITKTVLLLGVISLFTDIASEMLYPVMPGYLSSIGYGVVAIGFLEGIAEALSGIVKIFFAHRSDVTGKRRQFLSLGYGLSAISKPLIGFMGNIGVIFGAKLADRVGKGMRTAPRDALLTDESAPEDRGKVFGFHRGLDTLGAVLGPALGLLILYIADGNVRPVFLLAFIPGVIATILTFYLPKEKPKTQPANDMPTTVEMTNVSPVAGKPKTLRSILNFWHTASPMYKKLFFGFVAMSLINSTNMFLLLRAGELGFSAYMVIAIYLIFNVSYASLSYPLGALADKYGFKPVYAFGLIAFAIVYAALGYGTHSLPVIIMLFIVYGVFAAVEDGMAKAWLTHHIEPKYKATGIGFYLLFNSLALLVASVATGFVWKSLGSGVTLSLVAMLSIVILMYILTIKENKTATSPTA